MTAEIFFDDGFITKIEKCEYEIPENSEIIQRDLSIQTAKTKMKNECDFNLSINENENNLITTIEKSEYQLPSNHNTESYINIAVEQSADNHELSKEFDDENEISLYHEKKTKHMVVVLKKIDVSNYSLRNFFKKKKISNNISDNFKKDKVFQCPDCWFSSLKRGVFLNHLRFVHTDERPFKCDICSKCFKRSKNLSEHILIHLDKRPHKCTKCDKTFKRGYELKHHLSLHNDLKPYKCNECSKTFKTKCYLKNHISLHINRNVKCNDCNKTFKTEIYLKQHSLIHSGKKPFECKKCNKSYPSSKSLLKHQKTKNHKKISERRN